MSRRVGPTTAVVMPLLVALAVAAVLGGPTGEVAPAAAQSTNRAAVIVHTGGSSTAVCVRFTEPTITGLDALQRAGLGAVVRSFAGQGAAVCGINGVGCSADNSCLTCQAPKYWAYHRAGPGAGGFTLSGSGAGSTQVSDGSVEGWQWGTGAAPPFQTVDQVCGPATPPTSVAARPAPDQRSPATGGSATATPGRAGGSGGGSPAAGGGSTDAPTTTAPVATTTTAPTTTTTTADGERERTDAGDDGTEIDGRLTATGAPEDASGDGGGSPWAVALFALLVAGMGATIVVIRRRHSV